MKVILRYAGVAALTFSLFMLSLGSTQTSEAATVGSQLTVTITCGLTVVNTAIDWANALDPSVTPVLRDSLDAGDFTGLDPQLTNPAANKATSLITASVGTNTNGGYAGTTDAKTHIEPSNMKLDLVTDTTNALVAMDNADTAVEIGRINPGVTDSLQLTVLPVIVGQPISDATWAATITLTALCAIT